MKDNKNMNKDTNKNIDVNPVNFYLSDEEFEFDMRNIFRIFNLNSKIKFNYKADRNDDDFLSISIFDENIKKDDGTASIEIFQQGRLVASDSGKLSDVFLEKEDLKKRRKTLLKKLLYKCLSEYYNYESSYGILSGIRPGKIVTKAYENGFSANSVRNIMENTYGISHEKYLLLERVYEIQKKYIGQINDGKYNLYIGIPFCPTKCIYCNFVSFAKYEDETVEEYVKVLKKDIEETMLMAEIRNLELHTIYFGGGTPSVLNNNQIKEIFDVIKAHVNLDIIEEINFEAGRADTIDRELLKCLKEVGVNRICINPQTMNQKTLDLVKRNHTVKDVIDAYNAAREIGFDSINMDLIIGLPGENIDDVERTLKEVIELEPENLTVHTLSFKNGSKLFDMLKEFPQNTNSLLDSSNMTKKYCELNGYIPYYMYRQKKTRDNLENIGYCKPGKESIYNIVIIEEIETILACGAGAASKIFKEDGRHTRYSNYKNLRDYMEKVDKNIREKREILEQC